MNPSCILKCEVILSQRINSKPYDVWVVVQKNKLNESGGYIHSAYCTCTAGILGTCNLVTDILFRTKNAVQTGQTTQRKTSVLCTRNIRKGQRPVTTVKPVRDLGFEKSDYAKPESKSVKLANDKKEYLDLSPAVTNHGTIIRTGITCKKIPCYTRDSSCRWFIVKNAKIF